MLCHHDIQASHGQLNVFLMVWNWMKIHHIYFDLLLLIVKFANLLEAEIRAEPVTKVCIFSIWLKYDIPYRSRFRRPLHYKHVLPVYDARQTTLCCNSIHRSIAAYRACASGIHGEQTQQNESKYTGQYNCQIKTWQPLLAMCTKAFQL